MQLALAASFAGICLSACSGYSAQDYVSDMKALTEEQKRELEQYAEDVTDKAAEFDHEELKAQFEDIADRADELIDGLMEKLNAND